MTMIPLGSLSSLAAISSSLLAIYSSLAYGIILPAKRQFTKPPGFSLHTSGTGVKASNLDLGNTSSQSLTVSNFRDALVSTLSAFVFLCTVPDSCGLVHSQCYYWRTRYEDNQFGVGMCHLTLVADATVQLDTGSVDFWVYIPDTPLKLTNKTTIRITERYGIGSASGILSFAELQLGQYTVPNQGKRLTFTASLWHALTSVVRQHSLTWMWYVLDSNELGISF